MTEEPLLPTPDASQNRKSRRAMTPRELLLPTPNAAMANYDERPRSWRARAERLKEKHRNGNGAGTPLGIVAQELSSPSSPVSEGSTLPSNRLGGCLSARSRLTLGAPNSSDDTGRLFPVGPQSRTSDRNVPTPTAQDFISRKSTSSEVLNYETGKSVTLDRWAEWISSAEGSPASQSATPASARPRPTPGGSGPSSPVSFASLDPDGSWLRTYPDSSVQATLLGLPLARFSGTWPRSGSLRDGHVYAHQMSVPPIDGRGSFSLPTPRVSDANGAGQHGTGGPDLRTAMGLLPTPTTRDWKDGRDPSENVPSNGLLGRVVPRLLPTPMVGDAKSARNSTATRHVLPPTGIHKGDTLTDILVPNGDRTDRPSNDGSD